MKILGMVNTGVLIGLAAAFIHGCGRDTYTERNLEENALEAPYGSNFFTASWPWNRPVLRNEDIDDDGLYESILIYDKNDQKVYSEVRVGSDGELEILAAQPYN